MSTNRTGLQALVSELIETEKVAPYPIEPTANPESYYAKHFRDLFVLRDPETNQRLVRELENDPELRKFDGAVFETSTGGFRVQLSSLADWVLAQSLSRGTEAPIRDLERFLALGYLPYSEIVALSGLYPRERVDLGEDVFLVPIRDISQSAVTDQLFGIPRSLTEFTGPKNAPRPSAAIFKTVKKEPPLVADFSMGMGAPPSYYSELMEISRSFSAIGPSGWIAMAHWCQVEDWIPLARSGSAWNMLSYEIVHDNYTELAPAEVSAFVSQYRATPDSIKTKLRVPLDRLNQCMRRRRLEDRAIELGIALESLVVSDRSAADPISLPLRLRSAIYLDHGVETRRKTYRTIKKAYELRSKAVHEGGLVDSEENRKTIDEAAMVCAQIIRKIVSTGVFPDWDNVILESGAQ